MHSKFSILALTFLLAAPSTWALTRGAKALIDFETKSNGVSQRSNEEIKIPHFEIPLELLEIDFADRFSADIRKHLIFEKEGKKYVRWILNPEDTKWHLEVSEYFKSKGLQLEKQFYFTGFQTASRSYIVEDPAKEIQFSVKSSTNKTGGYWADKKQPTGEADDSRLNADYLAEVQKKLRFEHAIVMDEPAIMKIPKIDQAVVIRDLADLNSKSSNKYYVPGFSVLHEKTGKEIAQRNGSDNPYAFWTKHYIKATARALAELAARTGMQFDSPHSQNFLVELDSNYRPTGRIVLRDLADIFIYTKFVKVAHPQGSSFIEKFSQKDNILDHIAAGFGPLHGNVSPSWITKKGYNQWKDVFFEEFEKTFSETSGLPKKAFKIREGVVSGQYYGNAYKISKDHDGIETFWKNLRKYQSPKGILNCSFVWLSN